MQIHYLGDVAQREFLMVVEADDDPLGSRHFLNGLRQQALQLRTLQQARRPVLLVVRDVLQQIAAVVFRSRGLQTAQVHAPDIHQPLVVFLERKL